MLGLRVRPPVSNYSKRGTCEATTPSSMPIFRVSNYSKRDTCEASNGRFVLREWVSNYSKRGTCEAPPLGFLDLVR